MWLQIILYLYLDWSNLTCMFWIITISGCKVLLGLYDMRLDWLFAFWNHSNNDLDKVTDMPRNPIWHKKWRRIPWDIWCVVVRDLISMCKIQLHISTGLANTLPSINSIGYNLLGCLIHNLLRILPAVGDPCTIAKLYMAQHCLWVGNSFAY